MKKILVPIDGSKPSQKAAEKAVELAKQFGGEITFLTVVHIPSDANYAEIGISVSDTFLVNREKMVKEKLKHDGEMLNIVVDKVDYGDLKIERKVLVGEAYEQILKLANEGNYDLIVLSPRGFSIHKHFFIGSVAKKVISEARCSVLIVKE